MIIVRLLWIVIAGIALLPAAPPPLERLEKELDRVAQVSGGIVGASAIHLQSGRQVSLRGKEAFPMASTFKVPVAIEILKRVEAGQEQLDRMITIQPQHLHPGSGTLTDLFNKPGVALSVRNLLELMLLISDNSAADLLLHLAGGPSVVTARMKELGFGGIRIDRPCSLLIADIVGIETPPGDDDWTDQKYGELYRAVTPAQRQAARARFEADPRDTAAPEAMAGLLAHLQQGKILNPESTALLLDIMSRCRTGDKRIKGLLPEGAPLAHKTGTIGRSAADVGILTLPDGSGHVALAVFVKEGAKTPDDRERAIAEVSRTIYDFFLLDSPARFEAEVSRLAGPAGAAVLHTTSGRAFQVNGSNSYAAASTIKVAIAMEVLQRVDAGRERLDRMVTITRSDIHPGSGTLFSLFGAPGDVRPGLALSIRSLLEVMLLVSDNTATDVLTREIGGPAKVASALERLGVKDMFYRGTMSQSQAQQRSDAAAARRDPLNKTTPVAMARLLEGIARGTGLKPASQELLLNILERCQTGELRIKGMLPAGTIVRHKTGSNSLVTADAGLVVLPETRESIAVSVYVPAPPPPGAIDLAVSERIIAHIARAAYDYFLFAGRD